MSTARRSAAPRPRAPAAHALARRALPAPGACAGAALALALTACATEDPTFCSPTRPCPQGQRCDLPNRTCTPADGGLRDGAGQGDARGTQAVGTACAGAGVCQSGYCVDGRCCQSACAGLCERCDLAGALGTCTAIPEGQDPAAECAGSDAPCAGTCDGARACRFDPTKVCDGACRSVPATGDTQALTFRCGDDGRCNRATAATTKLCAFSRCTG